MVVSASPCVTLGRLVNRNRLLRIRARKRHQTASSRYNAPPHTVIWSSGRLEASQGDLPRQRGDLISQRAEGRLHSPFGQDQAELNSFCRRTPRQLGKEARRGARAADGRLKGSSGHQQFIWRTGPMFRIMLESAVRPARPSSGRSISARRTASGPSRCTTRRPHLRTHAHRSSTLARILAFGARVIEPFSASRCSRRMS
jgi:hypothetical protein